MNPSTYKLKLDVSRRIRREGQELAREQFFVWLWQRFGDEGLLGVHEGTVLSEQAAEEGLETESWTVDSGEAPRERDWIEGRETEQVELFFVSAEASAHAEAELRELEGVVVGATEEQPDRDWDAEWKVAFLGSTDGVKVAPIWRILPPWVESRTAKLEPHERALRINPGAGFGTGTHETTQLCLGAIARVAMARSREDRAGLEGQSALDFGSGSGILAVGAALLGARVTAIEIDSLAISNAEENARLNGVETEIYYLKTLEAADEARMGRGFPLVVANILRPVLIQFAAELVGRLQPRESALVLSGLIADDVEPILEAFGRAFRAAGRDVPAVEVGALGEWRSVVYSSLATPLAPLHPAP